MGANVLVNKDAKAFATASQHFDDGVKAIAAALSHNTTLTVLRLSQVHIGIAGVEAIATVLKHNTSLQLLQLSDCCERGKCAVKPLLIALQHNTTLRTLRINDNAIGNDGVRLFASALEHNEISVRELDLSNTKFNYLALGTLLTALGHNTTLQKLTLSFNSIMARDIIAFATAIYRA